MSDDDAPPNNVRHLRALPTPTTIKPRRTYPTKYEILTRRRHAVELRIAGSSEAAISKLLAADPSINTNGNAVPGGYGWRNYVQGKPPPDDKTMRRAVANDLAEAMADARELVSRRSEDLLQLELERLDRVQTAIWNDVMASSHWHVFRWLQLSERRAKLMGWDSEKRVLDGTHTVSVGSAESPQPDYTPEYLAKMLEAFKDAELATPEAIQAAQEAVVIDVESVEVEPDAETG